MTKIKIYNTLSRSKEEIIPQQDFRVGMYSCGPTVYDYAHIGNLRKYVFDDLLRRTLEYFGYEVNHVVNITDVGHLSSDADEGEDKIEKGSAREGKDAWEIAKFYEKKFVEDLKELNIEAPMVMPRATEHIKEQVDLIGRLEGKGYTYKTSDGVYFDTAKFADYGKLANLDIEGLREGARVEANPEKRNPTDFALWKFSAPGGVDPDGVEELPRRQMEWPSPWGVGFPGWHVECSAMSTKYLGQPFEIHTGGVDLVNVHHTNEIAQSQAAYDRPLAKYWVHSEHLLEDGRKMTKSSGHFICLQDVKQRGFSPLDLRYFYLTAHYRTKLDFSWNSLAAARMARRKIIDFAALINVEDEGSSEQKEFFTKALRDFEASLADDLDTPGALAVVFSAISGGRVAKFTGLPAQEFLKKIDRIFAVGIDFAEMKIVKSETRPIRARVDVPDKIFDLAIERNIFKDKGDFETADKLREQILESGYRLEDGSEFTEIIKKII